MGVQLKNSDFNLIPVIGYPRDFHVNYARFNGFFSNVFLQFSKLGKSATDVFAQKKFSKDKLVVFVRTSLRSIRTATTSGQYSPLRPLRSVSKMLIFSLQRLAIIHRGTISLNILQYIIQCNLFDPACTKCTCCHLLYYVLSYSHKQLVWRNEKNKKQKSYKQ